MKLKDIFKYLWNQVNLVDISNGKTYHNVTIDPYEDVIVIPIRGEDFIFSNNTEVEVEKNSISFSSGGCKYKMDLFVSIPAEFD